MGPEAMSRRIAVSVVVSVMLVSAAVGCARTESAGGSAPADSTLYTQRDTLMPDVDTGYAVVTLPGTAESRGRFAGQLPQPIESYVDNPTAFRDLVRSRGWVGRERPRKCIDHPGCNNANNPHRAWLRIQAIEDAHDVSLNELPENGVVVARIMNVGKRTDSTYAMRPGTAEWYIVIEPRPGIPNTARQKLAKLTFQGNSDTPQRLEVEVLEEAFSVCEEHEEPRPNFPYADFRPCSVTVATDTANTSYLSARAWMACAHGCCTSNPVR